MKSGFLPWEMQFVSMWRNGKSVKYVMEREENEMEYKFTAENFQAEVLESGQPVLVDFYADWCGPCKKMAPVVEEMAGRFEGKVKVGKCNIDDNMEIAQKYRVMHIPTFILFKDGQAVDTHVGSLSKAELESKLQAAAE